MLETQATLCNAYQRITELEMALMEFRFIKESISREDVERCRQWFNAVHDVNPTYLENMDFALAKRLYELLGIRVPDSINSRMQHEQIPQEAHRD